MTAGNNPAKVVALLLEYFVLVRLVGWGLSAPGYFMAMVVFHWGMSNGWPVMSCRVILQTRSSTKVGSLVGLNSEKIA